jgi:two-component system, NarL family, invasion response regulator UvrY
MQKHNSILKIAIADDHAMVREAISSFINTWDDCKVILQASNGEEFLENLTPSYLPDIAIIDINMPIMNGYNTIKVLTEKHPSIKAIAYSMFRSEESLLLLLLAGARSFLHKGDDLYSIKKAIQEVNKTGYYFTDGAATKMMKQIVEKGHSYAEQHLCEKEILFLQLICSEKTYKEIAACMKISERQVEYLRNSLFERFEVQSRIGLAILSIEKGLSFVR